MMLTGRVARFGASLRYAGTRMDGDSNTARAR